MRLSSYDSHIVSFLPFVKCPEGTNVNIKDATINIRALFITNMPFPRGLLDAGCADAMVAMVFFSSGLSFGRGSSG